MNIQEFFAEFVSSKRKEKLIGNLPDIDRDFLIKTMFVISNTPYNYTELIDDEYTKVRELLTDEEASGEIIEQLNNLFQVNCSKVLEAINKKIDGVILSNDDVRKIVEGLNGTEKVQPEKKEKLIENAKEKYLSDQQKEKIANLEMAIREINNAMRIFVIDKYIYAGKPEGYETKVYQDMLAFLITYPRYFSIGYDFSDDKWTEFPLKSFILDETVNTGRFLFDQFKKGESIDHFFIEKYSGEMSLANSIKNSFIPFLAIRFRILKEIQENYLSGNYASVICTSLPVIEGVLWHYAKTINGKYNIFNESGGILSLNGKVIDKPTIGDLLKNSVLRESFNEWFISYFCNEFYNERNPILHGEVHCYECTFTQINAAKKIYTLETIIKYIEKDMKKSLFEQLEKEALPEKIKKFIEE